MAGSGEVQVAYIMDSFAEKTLRDSDESTDKTSIDADESPDSDEHDEYGDDVWDLPVMPTRQKSDSFATPSLRANSMPKRQQSAPSPFVGKLCSGTPSRLDKLIASLEPCSPKDAGFDDVLFNAFQPARQGTDSSSLPDEGFCRQETEQCWPEWSLVPKLPLQTQPLQTHLANLEDGSNDVKSPETSAFLPGDAPPLPQFGDTLGGNPGFGMLSNNAISQAMMMQACASSTLHYLMTTDTVPANNEGGLQETSGNSENYHRRKYPSLIDLAAEQQQSQQKPMKQQPPQRKNNQKKMSKPKATRHIGSRDAADAQCQGGAHGDPSSQRIPKFCPYCGGKALAKFKFCQYCGEDLDAFHKKQSM